MASDYKRRYQRIRRAWLAWKESERGQFTLRRAGIGPEQFDWCSWAAFLAGRESVRICPDEGGEDHGE